MDPKIKKEIESIVVSALVRKKRRPLWWLGERKSEEELERERGDRYDKQLEEQSREDFEKNWGNKSG